MNYLQYVSLAALVALAGCACLSGDSDSAKDPPPTASAPLANDMLVRDLLDTSAEFTVLFDWTDPRDPGSPGTFIWRQSNGSRRWDLVQPNRDDPRLGEILFEANVNDPIVTLHIGCVWDRVDGNLVHLSCAEGSAGGRQLTVLDGLTSKVDGTETRTEIAGHSAACIAFEGKGPPTIGEYCYAIDSRVPVRLTVNSSRFVATEVSLASSPFTLPIELVEDPTTGIFSADLSMDIADLRLPSSLASD